MNTIMSLFVKFHVWCCSSTSTKLVAVNRNHKFALVESKDNTCVVGFNNVHDYIHSMQTVIKKSRIVVPYCHVYCLSDLVKMCIL